MNRCLHCFSEFEDIYDICPECGEPLITEPSQPIDLIPGTILDGRYIVGLALNRGGFGIVYKAFDIKFNNTVAIKEFFVSRLGTRAYGIPKVIVTPKTKEEYYYRKARFLAEARYMANYSSHNSFVNVFDYFEQNNTAYFVMEYIVGEDLKDRLKREKKLPVDEAVNYVNEVAKALISLHKDGIIHCDVAPDNIRLHQNGAVKLLDLGAAKLADAEETVIDVVVKPGYAPPEQYDNAKDIGAWTDVYGLGATLYNLITGIVPTESTNRKTKDELLPPHDIDPTIPENISNTVMKAMAVDKHLRFKDVDEFVKALNGEKKIIPLAQEIKKRKRHRFTGITAAVIIVCILSGMVFNYYRDKKAEQVLRKANITIWFCADKGDPEEIAVNQMVNDLKSNKTFKNISFKIERFDEVEYSARIKDAAEKGELPSVFESTDIDERILSSANRIDRVLESEQAKDCLFLNQYRNYYKEAKKLPLGIEVPVAVVITNGPTKSDYKQSTYSAVSDFKTEKYASEDEVRALLLHNSISNKGVQKEAVLNKNNLCPLLFTSTMHITEADRILSGNVEWNTSYYSGKTFCNFVYEWSSAAKDENEILAAEKILSWMLGNVYQQMLMVTYCHNGQIPINKTAFDVKINSSKYLTTIDSIKDNLVFEN